MPYLIDGDNLLGTWPGRKRSDAGRRTLGLELQRLGHEWRRRVIVVFDGTAPPDAAAGAGIRFSGAGRTADQVILSILGEQAERRGWLVVTSDRSLGDQCRYLGARVERCDRFRKRMVSRSTGEKPTREDDVDAWLETFGGDEPEERG